MIQLWASQLLSRFGPNGHPEQALEAGDALGLDFFFNDTATTEIYTLSLHDALRSHSRHRGARSRRRHGSTHRREALHPLSPSDDRKSTRLNSSHTGLSYAVFCL